MVNPMAKHHSPILLPEDIKYIRESLNMTSEQFGEIIGYKGDSIRQLESPHADWGISDMTAHRVIGIYLGIPKDKIPSFSLNSSQYTIDQTVNGKAH